MTALSLSETASPSTTLGRKRTSLVLWGALNCIIILAVMLLPSLFVGAGFQRLLFLSVGLWVLVSIGSGLVPLRIPLTVALFVPLQLWYSFCTLYGELSIGHVVPPNGLDYLMGIYLICFLLGSGLAFVDRRVSKWTVLVFIGLCLFSALVALAQFAGFGPAMQYSQFIAALDVEARTSEFETIRAAGVFAGVGWSAVFSLVAALMIASRWRFSNAKWYEVVAILLLFAAAFSNQVRNQLPLIAITGLGVWVMAVRRHRTHALYVGLLVLIVAAATIILRIDRFAYMFSTSTDTLDYRRNILWTQALNVFSQHPWTGIGVEPAFSSWTTQVLPNKWVSMNLMDNGWYITLAWGGLPALCLLILIIVSANVQSFALLRASKSVWSSALSHGTLVFCLAIALGLFFGNQYTNPTTASFIVLFAGFAAGTVMREHTNMEPVPK